MSVWHLLWMFVTALGIIALALAVPFVWAYAVECSSAKRARGKRLFWMVVAKSQRRDGLPCSLEHWAHHPLERVPGVGFMCRRCGWARKETA